MSQSDSSGNIDKSEKIFTDFKAKMKRKWIVNHASEMLEENPDLTAEEIGKKLKCSKSTIVRAFDEREKEEIISEPFKKLNITDLVVKLGLGVTGISIFSDIDKTELLVKNMIEPFLTNKIFLQLSGVIYLLYTKFIKPKIEESKLSEIEVIIEFVKSPFGLYCLLGYTIILLGPELLEQLQLLLVWITEQIKNSKENISNSAQIAVNTDSETALNGKIIPSQPTWIDQLMFEKKKKIPLETIHAKYGYYYPSILKKWWVDAFAYWQCKKQFLKDNNTPKPDITQATNTGGR